MSGTSNASVTTDPSVASCVALILLNLSITGCRGTTGTGSGFTLARVGSAVQTGTPLQQSSEVSEAERVEMGKHPFILAPERMSVKAPEADVPLGSPIVLNITLAPGKLVGSVEIVQRSPKEAQSQGSGPAKIISEQGSNKTVEITPTQIGLIDVEVGVLYLDNAAVRQTIRLNVVPSAKGLKEFSIDQGFHAMRLRIDGKKSEQQTWLRPMVVYEGLRYPIYLENSSQIRLVVEQEDGNPVISVDKNGLVHALREGRAVIVGYFDGVKDQIRVTVSSLANQRQR